MTEEVYLHLGADDCDIPHLQERKVAEKEVHGLVQLSIAMKMTKMIRKFSTSVRR